MDTLTTFIAPVLRPAQGQPRLPDDESPNQEFRLSDEHVNTLVGYVSHNLATRLGSYLHAIQSANSALKKNEMRRVRDHLSDADREMTANAGTDRRQPSLLRIFDDPLSIVQQDLAHPELAQLLADPTRCASVVAVVTPVIRAFNDRLQPAFRSLQEQHRRLKGVVESGLPDDPVALERALLSVIEAGERLEKGERRIYKAWYLALAGAKSVPVATLSTELHRRMGELLEQADH